MKIYKEWIDKDGDLIRIYDTSINEDEWSFTFSFIPKEIIPLLVIPYKYKPSQGIHKFNFKKI